MQSRADLATLFAMNHDDAQVAARMVTAFAARLAGDQHLAAEMQRARRDFFPVGHATGASVPGAADAAEQRFAEWFTLERESEVLGAVPVDVPAWSQEAADLADSAVGVWLVLNVGPNAVEARDVQEGHSIELDVPPASLQAGDLVVGRLFAQGAGRFTPSTAAAIFRPGAPIAQAFARDYKRLELDRRLQQIELEHLLLRRPQAAGVVAPAEPPVPLEHLEADLDRLLERSASEHTATGISAQLATAARPGPVLGPLLDELAFDTDVDLDRARALLLAIWNAHHADEAIDPPPTGTESAGPPGETLGERLVRTLDEGLAQKRDVEELFAELERMAGIDAEQEDDEDDDGAIDDDADAAAAPERRPHARDVDDDDEDEDHDDDSGARAARVDDDEVDGAEGNLGPLIEEYLWETDRDDTPAAAALRAFAELQQNAALPHRDLEEVTSVDVMRLLLHVYLGAAPTERAERVQATFGELRGFYRWAIDTQELPVTGVLEGCQGALLDQLERLQAAGIALSSSAPARVRPGVLEVEDLGDRGFGVRDDDGGDHWIDAPAAALPHLRVGDLVLAGMAPGGANNTRTLAGLVVVLPADARALIE